MVTIPAVETPRVGELIRGREIVVPLRLRRGEREVSFFSTAATFGTATDITLASLTIEAFYPATAQTATVLLEAL
jgi:hypothetical protein